MGFGAEEVWCDKRGRLVLRGAESKELEVWLEETHFGESRKDHVVHFGGRRSCCGPMYSDVVCVVCPIRSMLRSFPGQVGVSNFGSAAATQAGSLKA